MVAFLTVGVAVPTPGAVGGFHEFYLLALTQAFGVDKHVAAAAGIACHALTNLPVLVLGLALWGGKDSPWARWRTWRRSLRTDPGARLAALEPTRPR